MEKQVCIKCGKSAYKVYKPDLDVEGIGMCSHHQEEVTLDLMVANFNGWDKFKEKYSKDEKE